MNTTDITQPILTVFQNGSLTPGNVVEYSLRSAFGPFVDLLPAFVAVFVLLIAFIRTKDLGTITFMTLAYIGIYLAQIQETILHVIVSVLAMILAGLLWKALGRKLSPD